MASLWTLCWTRADLSAMATTHRSKSTYVRGGSPHRAPSDKCCVRRPVSGTSNPSAISTRNPSIDVDLIEPGRTEGALQRDRSIDCRRRVGLHEVVRRAARKDKLLGSGTRFGRVEVELTAPDLFILV
jgi:hypothetical protein